jgi:cytochrome c-type biogenesis protein CcmH/NrfG
MNARQRTHLLLGLVVLATLAVYWQAIGHGFVNFDDRPYVTDNPRVSGGLTMENVRWAFTAAYQSNWHPLTWLSHQLDCQLFGLAPRGHHLVNVLLHTLNSLLVGLVLWRFTGAGGRSVLVAALFALHPLHVESVAWVAERKDVLSSLFWLLTLLAYGSYVTRPGLGRYLLVLGALALGLLAKPMLVTLPCVLLLLDYWPLGRFSFAPGTTPAVSAGDRIRRGLILVGEKLPLLLLAVASALVTYRVQLAGGTVGTAFPLAQRAATAVVAAARYLLDTVWPRWLAVLYPFDQAIPIWQVALSGMALAGLTVAALLAARRRPYMTVGWLWYLGTLVPVSGLVQIGLHSRADRYTYVPLLGIFIVIAWGGQELLARRPRLAAGLATACVVALSVVTWQQLGYWRDSITLFGRAARVTSNNYVAWHNLGAALLERKEYSEATAALRESLRINPLQPQALDSLGLALAAQGDDQAAIVQYRQAIRISRGFADVRVNLATSLTRLGQLADAKAALREALAIDPAHLTARARLGILLASQGDYAAAAGEFRELVRLQPGQVRAHFNLGLALQRQGNCREAVTAYDEVLRLAPDNREARENMESCRQKLAKE